MSQTQQTTETEHTSLRGPGKYHVIMLNDDTTPMEFVVNVLVNIFNKSENEANDIMFQVHEKGRAVAGTYSYEVAEQKAIETVNTAKQNGFPLDVSLEEE